MTAHDFESTFREFLTSGWLSPVTRARRQRWLDVRDEGNLRWARVQALRAGHAPLTDAVLLGMLPYSMNSATRGRSRWQHPSSTLTLDVRGWLVREGAADDEACTNVIEALVRFTERCLLAPERLAEHCAWFAARHEKRLIQSSLVSPLLNALVPERYAVVNAASIAALRAFTGVPWSPRIETYPKANEALRAFVAKHRDTLSPREGEGLRPHDVFDLFAQWFFDRAPEVLEEPWEPAQLGAPEGHGWKVSPGLHAQRWFKCLADESMAFAWPELGDLASLSLEMFRERVATLAVVHAAFREPGIEHLWHLARSAEGTLLVASRAPDLVLGLGRVTGAYRFLTGDAYPHRLDVDWFDVEERSVDREDWSAVLAPVPSVWIEQALKVSKSGEHTRVDLSFADAYELAESTVAMAASGDTATVSLPPPVNPFNAPTVRLARAEHGWVASSPPSASASPPPLPRTPSAPAARAPSVPAARPVSGVSPAASGRPSAPVEGHDDTGFTHDELRRLVDVVRRKGQAIVSGPTGTGKTFLARHLARLLAGEGGVVEQLQLHANYRYEDFVERNDRGARVPGRLPEFLGRAAERGGPAVLILDDVHRADLARVMGEAMHAFEYRDEPVRLASGAELRIPREVILLGTMNAAERAITVADQSLRRRFAFLPLPPRYDVLGRYLAARGYAADALLATLRTMNDALGPDATLGLAGFFRDDLADVLETVWTHEVEPHLEQHLAQNPAALASLRWTRVRESLGA